MSKDDEDVAPGEVVDFDALNAALGALPPPPTSSSPVLPDSQGRSSATYASARPHTIPPTRAPADDPNAPAVIVKTDDTVQTGPPAQMTMPMTPGMAPPGMVAPNPGVMPHGHHAPPNVRPPSPSSPDLVTPQPFALPAPPPGEGGGPPMGLTMRMPERPRRPKAATIVVRARGPTKLQKALVFVAMLLVFVAGGVAFLVVYKPPGLNLDVLVPRGPAATSASPLASPAPATPATAPAGTSATPSAAPSASAKKVRSR